MSEASTAVPSSTVVPRNAVHALVIVCNCKECSRSHATLLQRLTLHPDHAKFYPVAGSAHAIVKNGVAGKVRKKLVGKYLSATKVVVVATTYCLEYKPHIDQLMKQKQEHSNEPVNEDEIKMMLLKSDLLAASAKIISACSGIGRNLSVELRLDSRRTVPETLPIAQA